MSDMREPGGERERKTWEALNATMKQGECCSKCGVPLEWYIWSGVRCYESCKTCALDKKEEVDDGSEGGDIEEGSLYDQMRDDHFFMKD